MITRERIFEEGFVPNDIVHRDQETDALARTLDPLTTGDQPNNIFLTGSTGTGKTCIARFTLNRLQREAPSVNIQYVNCWDNHSRFNAFRRILDGVDQTLDIHRQSTPTDLLLERIRSVCENPYVIILDEVDQLDDMGVLYSLKRTSDLWMILITTDENDRFFGRIDDRIKSRFQSSTQLELDPYETNTLISILQDRVEAGLRPDAIKRPQLKMIADAADGNAETAINTLYTAAHNAEQEHQKEISNDHVRDAIPEAKRSVRQKNIEKLKPSQKTLHDIITEYGEITPGELYNQYENKASSSKSKRTLRNHLSKMEHYNLIISKGKKRGRTYAPIS